MELRTSFSRVGLMFFIVFFGLQLLGIGYARIEPTKFFCWAPYDQISEYQITVQLNDRVLTDREVRRRYRINANGFQSRSIDNVLSIIRKYERTYGKADHAIVSVNYVINQYRSGTWSWPQTDNQ